MTDTIADFLTRIRNANTARKEQTDIPLSKTKKQLASILKSEGFIKDYQVLKEGPQGSLRVTLKYGRNNEKGIRGLKRISKPGLRVYVGKGEVPKVLGGLGLVILSTNKGVMSDKDARHAGLGGEVLCYVW